MAPQKKFTIDKVRWHTQAPGNTETVEEIGARFRAIILFLQEHGLTVKPILRQGDPVTDDLAIVSTDLTEDGLELMKRCHDKWLRQLDRGASHDDLFLFEKELAKMQGERVK